MQGFLDNVALTVAVSWLKNVDGTYVETQLLDGEPFPFGLLAFTQDTTGTITRWFVPWTSVVYIKQGQPSPATSQPANPVVRPSVPPVDPPVG